MFTGIIQHVGAVQSLSQAPLGRRLAIDVGPLAEGLKRGDSVAVNGACLTVSDLSDRVGEFDVVAETLSRTTLGRLRAGGKVNLERALRLGDGLDGHLVQGHVDGVATLKSIRLGGECVLTFHAGCDLTGLMVVKGSVAIDGVSLTLAEAGKNQFSVAIIPTTLERTTLGLLKAGDEVNIETDILGKYVQKLLGDRLPLAGNLTMDTLRKHGFA